jgi:hypothetical protein
VDLTCDDSFMRAVTDPIEAPTGESYVVEALPRGAIRSPQLDNEILQWTSGIPLLAELAGWIRHRLVYKGAWTVVVTSVGAGTAPVTVHQESVHSRREAAQRMAAAVESIRSGKLQSS